MIHHWDKNRPAIVLADEGSGALMLMAGSSERPYSGKTLLEVTDPKLLKKMGLHRATFFCAEGVTRKFISELIGRPIGRCTPDELDTLIDGSRAEVETERRKAEMPPQRPGSGPRSMDPPVAKKRRV